MTFASFNDYIAEAEPIELASFDPRHANGDGDGYAWAFSGARDHLPDGGEWPYYIAAIPTPGKGDVATSALSGGYRNLVNGTDAPEKLQAYRAALLEGAGATVLETYCEGDLTAYIFETKAERDEAASRWQESHEELIARLIDDGDADAASVPTPLGGELLEAIAAEIDANNPTPRPHPAALNTIRDLVDAIESVTDRYMGEWDSLSDYAAERERELNHEALSALPDHIARYIDWGRFAAEYDNEGYTTHPAGGGNVHIFDPGA